ncbi:MAG: ParA family protein [Oscillospiraceae bacterium]|jgi:chromosome partitioning protein|nr:ParA family protein [Oscillospiraceae bacterium]
MGKIIAVVNQKGGVGKTTTCVNTAYALSQAGRRVLLCDFDPQGNATSGMGLSKSTAPGSYDAVIRLEDPAAAVHTTNFCDVMPAGKSLSGAEIEMMGLPRREHRLHSVLQALAGRYDFILIDCPPSLGLLTLNGLCAADSFLVPVQCEYYALEGLSDLLYTVRAVKQGGLNAELELEGVLLTMFDARTNLSLQVAEEVKRHFPGKIYKTVVPRNVRLSEAPSHGMPVQKYDPASKGADSYDALAREIVKRNRP